MLRLQDLELGIAEGVEIVDLVDVGEAESAAGARIPRDLGREAVAQAEVPGVLALRGGRRRGGGLKSEEAGRRRVERVARVVAHALAAPAERQPGRARELDQVLDVERFVLLRRANAIHRLPQAAERVVAARVVAPGEPVRAEGQAVLEAAEPERHARARRRREHAQLVLLRAELLHEKRVGLLAPPIEAEQQLGLAEHVRERRARALAVAARVVERRLRAARIGRVLVQADGGLHDTRARQAEALVVGAEAQVECRGVERPAQVGRVVLLLVAVVGAIAVRRVAVDRGIDADVPGRIAAIELAFARAERSDAAEGFDGGALLERRARHDVDDARARAVAVEHRARAAHHLDAFDAGERDRRPLRAGEVRIREAAPVDEHQRVLRPADAVPAQVDRGDRGVVAVEVLHGDADLLLQQLGQRARRAPGDVVLADHADARRQPARVLGEAQGVDHDRIAGLRSGGQCQCKDGEQCREAEVVAHEDPFRCHPRHPNEGLSRLQGRSPDSRVGGRTHRMHAFP